ncbi:MAG TPA: ABC transporter substrate-binding protein [Bryobacteraceae bacterium]|nr:ABC transporter substrate-binding protein [Bryobacteraceae bacterium]
MKPLLWALAAAASLTPGTVLRAAQPAENELRFCLRADPKTFNPLLVSEEPDEIINFLTGGVLIRLNRATQQLEGELAESWHILDGGRRIEFRIRPGVRFSDGSPLAAQDVFDSLRALLDPDLHSPAADPLLSDKGPVTVTAPGGNRVIITFPAPVAGLERLFDQVPVSSARALAKADRPSEMPVLGRYRVVEYRAGSYVLLERNLYYWKKDSAGRQLPYIGALRLAIQQNRDLELVRFERGDIHLINRLDPESFDRLKARMPASARDAGPSLESDQLWFNQVARAPLPEFRKQWFRSREFRQAISAAINRADIARVVYRGYARLSFGPVSPANRIWFNARLAPAVYDTQAALARLGKAGFRLDNGTLRDRAGNPVEFSVITNSGNKERLRTASMIQQDLALIGIRLHVVTLDFGSLIERITRTFEYDACLLGLVNVDLDPSAQMNILLSSASNHPWNPAQPSPETAWEAEIDRLMRAQAIEISPHRRKALFDRVQEIIVDQAPVLYLVDKDALSAVSPSVAGASPAVLDPQTFWNIESLYFRGPQAGSRH